MHSTLNAPIPKPQQPPLTGAARPGAAGLDPPRPRRLSPLRAARLVELAAQQALTPATDLAIAERELDGLTHTEREKVIGGRSIPNRRLREAALRWVEQENLRRVEALGGWRTGGHKPLASLNELFDRAGFENSHARRFLGLAPVSDTKPRLRKPAPAPRFAAVIRRDYAMRLLAAMHLDPVDVDL